MDNVPTFETPAPSGRLLIVDGHAYAYRAFFAIRSLTSPSGRPVNAIYGFIRMLMKMRERLQPSHAVVIWDGGLAEERTALLPEYKAQRPPTPEDLESQFDQITAYLRAAGIYSCQRDGVEADDLIADLALTAAARGVEVVIASSDKDFMQLVGGPIRLLNPNDKSEALWGAAEVRNKTGVNPEQIIDLLSLMGDAVDNIPGVPGVGPKTAADLLQRFGTVEELLRRLPEAGSERLRASLDASREQLARNRKMVALHGKARFEAAWDALASKAGDVAAMRELFTGWGFKGMLRELNQAHGGEQDFFAAPGAGRPPEPRRMATA